MPECPKCGGGAFLSEEDLIKILENTEPIKIVIKAVYQCRACAEKFSRLVHDTLDARKKDNSSPATGLDEAAEGLKFF